MKFREALTVWRARGFTGRLCRAKDIHDGCPCVYYTARQDDTGEAEDFTIHRRGEKPVGDPFWGSVWLPMDDDWTILEDEK